MVLSINKVIKNNICYFFLMSFAMYLYLVNIFTYEEYWHEKIDRAFGELDCLGDEVFGIGVPYILDYSGYKIRIYTITTGFLESWYGLALIGFMFIAAVLYIIIPLVLIYFNAKLKVVCIVLDIICCIVHVWLYRPAIEAPLYGFVPLCILVPMLFLMLVWVRIRQYNKLLKKE